MATNHLERALVSLGREQRKDIQAELRAFADYHAHRINGVLVVKMDDLMAFLDDIA